MLFKAYKRVLLGISISISLLLLASPASAMCFYNKMNPRDFVPEGYYVSQGKKAVKFVFEHDGIHFYYSKRVSLNQHQCIGGGGASVSIAPLGSLDPWPETTKHVDPHGYVVVETEPSDWSTSDTKYFKLKMSVYSQSNALQNTFTRNLECISDYPSLRCWII